MSSAPDIRIAYVYAAPLVRRVDDAAGSRWAPIDRLDVQREKVILTRVVRKCSRAVRWRETVATSSSFWQVVLHGCRILHFTGHGMRDGTVCFEDSFGRMHAVDRDALKSLFTKGHARAEEFGRATAGVQCVFVSACHSESVAEAFVAAGVPHVVAVRTEDEVMDDASLTFAGAFYEALLADKCQSVKQAFESAKTVVRNAAEDWAETEHSKFLLLGHGDPNERLFADAPLGEWVDETPRIDDRCPDPVQQFTGRERDVQAIYNDVLHSRCVVIIGACGIGKTQVARRVATYLAERTALNAFSSVVSVDMKSITGPSDMAPFFARALDVTPTPESFFADLHTRYPPSNKCLAVVDGCEAHADVLGEFLSMVAAHGAGLSFLLTSVTAFSLRDLACKEYTLRPLPAVDAARLFVARATRPISEFHPSGPLGVDPFVALSRTAIMKALRGHPGAICYTAAKLREYNLVIDEDRFLREIIPQALREFESESGRNILNVGLSQFFGSPALPPTTAAPVPPSAARAAGAGGPGAAAALPSTAPAGGGGGGAAPATVVPPAVAAAINDPAGLRLWQGLHQQARFAGVSGGDGSTPALDLSAPAVWRLDFVTKGLEVAFQAEVPFLLTRRRLTPADFEVLAMLWGMPHCTTVRESVHVMPLEGFKAWWGQIRLWLRMMAHSRDDWCCADTVMHGFLRSEDTRRALVAAPSGAFLFRFSVTHPGLLALSCQEGGEVNNFLVHPTHPGVLLMTQGGGRYSFASLLEMVEKLPTLQHRIPPRAPALSPASGTTSVAVSASVTATTVTSATLAPSPAPLHAHAASVPSMHTTTMPVAAPTMRSTVSVSGAPTGPPPLQARWSTPGTGVYPLVDTSRLAPAWRPPSV